MRVIVGGILLAALVFCLGASEAQARRHVPASVEHRCQVKWGERFVRVDRIHGRTVCMVRKSTAALTRQAARRCVARGMTFMRVTKIGIKGNRSVTHYLCRRKVPRAAGLRTA